ncbi:flagellar motor protein MotD [Exilibacterium tricleocarpae]|uniref:Flagellar motor protein MotD n=1 Tax=Exilibacterium tricleocarpae TaxID=2591008 RepID=A0A545U3Z4_9GAMM|nr:flagellar motor protein MotD [Exilibacterium tricleocarpae]TQV84195.1 flagellar motor protein MotD [Exilibacterium tricleocarpae]
MPRRRAADININHERWLVSYSDFITLLFAFFVVMYSVSQVNQDKYRVLSDTLMHAFNNEPPQSLKPIQVGQPRLAVEPAAIALAEGKQTGEFSGDGAFEKMADLPQLSDQFSDQFAELIDAELVRVNSNEFWLQVELKSSILFPSGSAEPGARALVIFEEMAAMLEGFDNPVQVEGFTDSIPISNQRYASNWELSAARAAAVVKLLAGGGVAPQRLSAVGYGQFQPIADNATAQGRAENRRVVLMIARQRQQRPAISTPEQFETAVAGSQPQVGQEVGSLDSGALDNRDAGTAEPGVAAGREGIVPVELEGGGLLFSSDPDLPRTPSLPENE